MISHGPGAAYRRVGVPRTPMQMSSDLQPIDLAAQRSLRAPKPRILARAETGGPAPLALPRVSHLGIGAHQDDLEFLALHGLAECLDVPDRRFAGITCTDGRGSARAAGFAHLSDEEMADTRAREQIDAARIGGYAAIAQLGYTSGQAKQPERSGLVDDLMHLLLAFAPERVYTHNLADKHDTHVAVAIAVVKAARRMPPALRPKTVWGCEVWRDLDWMLDEARVSMDVSAVADLAEQLADAYPSQMSAKRYDLATKGRRVANATMAKPVDADRATQMIWGMDLSELIHAPEADISGLVQAHIRAFEADVLGRIARFSGD